jgi:hypothetical protein
MSAVGSRYQTTTGEDTAHWKDLVCVAVKCEERELMIARLLLVFTLCKCS